MDAVSSQPVGSNRVTIPEFQRRLVWNQDTRKELINSIKSGYPFGTILLYEDVAKGQQAGDGKHHFSLIDGLQRTQALKHYVEQQNGYFTRADLDDDFIDLIARRLGKETDEYRDRIRSCIVKWVKGRKSFDAAEGWATGPLIMSLLKDALGLPADSLLLQKEYFELSQDAHFASALGAFLDETSSEVKVVLDAKIPALRFQGDPSELPRIFELINTQGTALSRYEIFAARWIDTRQRIANEKIIEAIWNKYDALAEEGFSLDVVETAPDVEARLRHEYSLFDYLFGFGKVLCNDFSRLFKPVKDDQPSSVGFNLVTACVNLRVQDMGKLPGYIEGKDLATLEHCIVESIKFVDSILKPVLNPRRQGKQRPIYHSEMMIIAFIATAFHARYSINSLTENDGWKRDKKFLRKNLLMYYLSEILHDDWRGSGDSKLYDRVREYRYLKKPPDKLRWGQILEDWYIENQMELGDARQYISDKRKEYLLLRYIFADRLAKKSTYHVEHVIPTQQLLPLKPSGEKWSYNGIGNLALIEDAGELKHNTDTYITILRRRRDAGEISQNEFLQQCESFNRLLLCPPGTFPDTLTVKFYEDFLLERWELLKEAFIQRYHDRIPSAAISAEPSPSV